MRSVCAWWWGIGAVMYAGQAAQGRARGLWLHAFVDRPPQRVALFRLAQGEARVGRAGGAELGLTLGHAVAGAVDESQHLVGCPAIARRDQAGLQGLVQLLLGVGVLGVFIGAD